MYQFNIRFYQVVIPTTVGNLNMKEMAKNLLHILEKYESKYQ